MRKGAREKARIKREKFKERIRRNYHEMVEAGMDPYVAKLKILRQRRKLSSFLTIEQLREIIYRRETTGN